MFRRTGKPICTAFVDTSREPEESGLTSSLQVSIDTLEEISQSLFDSVNNYSPNDIFSTEVADKRPT